MAKKAVVLISGGLDSATTLAIAKSKGFECHALSIAYGQRHQIELQATKKICQTLDVKVHKLISINLNDLGGSALTDLTLNIPNYSSPGNIPNTYVPARNSTFLSIALGWAEVLGAQDIFIGACEIDYSGYPDCRAEYFEAFQNLANLATKAGIEGQAFLIHTPLLRLSKAQIIQLGLNLGLDYSTTISCYQADEHGRACGNCDACYYRKKGFLEAGIQDPTIYRYTKELTDICLNGLEI